jgi:hypothetical protein
VADAYSVTARAKNWAQMTYSSAKAKVSQWQANRAGKKGNIEQQQMHQNYAKGYRTEAAVRKDNGKFLAEQHQVQRTNFKNNQEAFGLGDKSKVGNWIAEKTDRVKAWNANRKADNAKNPYEQDAYRADAIRYNGNADLRASARNHYSNSQSDFAQRNENHLDELSKKWKNNVQNPQAYRTGQPAVQQTGGMYGGQQQLPQQQSTGGMSGAPTGQPVAPNGSAKRQVDASTTNNQPGISTNTANVSPETVAIPDRKSTPYSMTPNRVEAIRMPVDTNTNELPTAKNPIIIDTGVKPQSRPRTREEAYAMNAADID